MKYHIVISLLLTPISLLIAQPVVTRNHLMFPGDDFIVADVGNIPDPGPAGTNVTWDFSSVAQSSSVKYATQRPDQTPFGSNYPGANTAFVDITSGTDYLQYHYLSENIWGEHGYVSPGFSIVTFQNPRTYVGFPISYNNQWQDDFTYTIEYLPDPPFTTIGEGIVDIRVDGYGTLMLPQVTFDNVLRVRIIAEATDTSVIEQGLYEHNEIYDTSYNWFSPSYHAVLCSHVRSTTFRTTTIIIGDTLVIPETLQFSSFTFDPGAEPTSSISLPVAKDLHALHVRPNPCIDGTQVSFNTSRAQEMYLMIQNIYGQVYQTHVVAAQPGENRIDLNLAELPAGTYIALLQSGEGFGIQSLVKVD